MRTSQQRGRDCASHPFVNVEGKGASPIGSGALVIWVAVNVGGRTTASESGELELSTLCCQRRERRQGSAVQPFDVRPRTHGLGHVWSFACSPESGHLTGVAPLLRHRGSTLHFIPVRWPPSRPRISPACIRHTAGSRRRSPPLRRGRTRDALHNHLARSPVRRRGSRGVRTTFHGDAHPRCRACRFRRARRSHRSASRSSSGPRRINLAGRRGTRVPARFAHRRAPG